MTSSSGVRFPSGAIGLLNAGWAPWGTPPKLAPEALPRLPGLAGLPPLTPLAALGAPPEAPVGNLSGRPGMVLLPPAPGGANGFGTPPGGGMPGLAATATPAGSFAPLSLKLIVETAPNAFTLTSPLVTSI